MSSRCARSATARTRSATSPGRVCAGCRHPARTRAEVADLDVPWLLPGPDGQVAESRFCRGCVPPGEVGDVACVGCADGPLLASELAAADLLWSEAIDRWLEATGWRPSGPWCPDCRRSQLRPEPC